MQPYCRVYLRIAASCERSPDDSEIAWLAAFLCGTREQGDKLCWFYMLILSMIDLKSPMSHGGRTHQNDVLLAQLLIMYGKRSPGSPHPDSKFMVFGGLRFQTVIFPKKYLKPHLLMKHSCVCCSRLKFWSIRAQCFLVEPQIIFGKVPLLINISRVLIEFHSCRLGRSSPFCSSPFCSKIPILCKAQILLAGLNVIRRPFWLVKSPKLFPKFAAGEGLAGERTERRRQAVVKSKMIRKMVGKYDRNSREIVWKWWGER